MSAIQLLAQGPGTEWYGVSSAGRELEARLVVNLLLGDGSGALAHLLLHLACGRLVGLLQLLLLLAVAVHLRSEQGSGTGTEKKQSLCECLPCLLHVLLLLSVLALTSVGSTIGTELSQQAVASCTALHACTLPTSHWQTLLNISCWVPRERGDWNPRRGWEPGLPPGCSASMDILKAHKERGGGGTAATCHTCPGWTLMKD